MSTPLTARRQFLRNTGLGAAALALNTPAWSTDLGKKPVIGAHVWAFSANQPNYDCFPILDQVFSDLQYAGIEAVELMERNLRHNNSVSRLREVIQRYNLPVIGCSYSADFWNKDKTAGLLEDANVVISRLSEMGGRTFGITVGNAGRKKTADELDTQAETLKNVWDICKKYNVVPNLHNHTYEVDNNMHDLGGTLKRIPDFPLGPDLDWLFQARVDVLTFIEKYAKQMVYLHLRDHLWTGVWSEAIGEGIMDHKAIARALRKHGYQGDITIELAFPGDFKPTRPLRESWKMSRDYVRRTMGV
jgi:sugar phosphate isomerase/epimerase